MPAFTPARLPALIRLDLLSGQGQPSLSLVLYQVTALLTRHPPPRHAGCAQRTRISVDLAEGLPGRPPGERHAEGRHARPAMLLIDRLPGIGRCDLWIPGAIQYQVSGSDTIAGATITIVVITSGPSHPIP